MRGTALAAALLAASADPQTLAALAGDDAAAREQAIAAVVSRSDLAAAPALRALLDGRLYAAADGTALIEEDGQFRDARTGAPAAAGEMDKVSINNRLRRVLLRALAVLDLRAEEPARRLAAARAVQDSGDAGLIEQVATARRLEKDRQVREALAAAEASLALASPDPARRLAAVDELRRAPGAASKRLLVQRLGGEKDAKIAAAIRDAVEKIESSLRRAEMAGLVFSGLSLGSILLLAALGLAITFGLMGVINMAHGELLMVGAYATWLVQGAFRHAAPAALGWYLLAAVPLSFLAAALVGVVLELLVVRKLYGRPLETLLATWGASLLLMQAVRVAFGAQNVEVANPVWMSGGFSPLPGLVVPWNRVVILLFAAAVLLLVWALLTRTRLGLLVRAVTQDRQRAAGLGVPTPRVDLLAFALGAGIAGLGGCALSQIGNVGPDLGQGFIVDCFMVVVLGGVGQLAGTVIAAAGLGIVNKLLEPTAGAVLAKIAVLAFIILFIQRRPQGLFALRGRAAAEER
ncbi:MAG TPA: urea ABC transporter permease subunit UrtB [Myxococcales bacterium]|nr:urea ABC transporter permease subunit UrtB [Myxococcales bacterium]